MKRQTNLTTARAAEIYREMISTREDLCGDGDFIKAADMWTELFEAGEGWKLNIYRSLEGEAKLRAGVVVVGHNVTLTVEERFWDRAKRGCWMHNFVLAHELAHVALGHHELNAVTKNYKVMDSEIGFVNVPPTLEENEANYAAVFLQCGVALQDRGWHPVELARRAFSDPRYVRKAQSVVRLESFQDELKRLEYLERTRPKHPREVF